MDISTAILKLSESGKLQQIHEKWFCKMRCPDGRRRSSKASQLQLISFWGLYLLCGAFALGALLVFLLRMIRSYVRHKRQQQLDLLALPSASPVYRCTGFVFSFFNFIDKKEETAKRAVSSNAKNQQQQEHLPR